MLVITRSLLKHRDLNTTDFFLFLEDCASYGLSQDLSDKKPFLLKYLIWKYSHGSTRQFLLYKIKIRLLESDQRCLRHGISKKITFITL